MIAGASFNVVLDAGAEEDLRDIAAYLAEHRSREAARDLIAAILARIGNLETFPARESRPRELDATGMTRYRQIVFGPYRIIYRIGDREVTIVLVADGRRDMATLLRDRLLGAGTAG